MMGTPHDLEPSPLRQWLLDHDGGRDVADQDAPFSGTDGEIVLVMEADDFETWIEDADQGKSSDFGPQFGMEGAPSDDDGATTLPPVDSIGRRLMSEAEIQQILDDYNRTTTALPTGSGGGGNGGEGEAATYLPENLTNRDCATLAFWEREREEKISSGRGFAVAGLNATGDYFRGEQAYQEIYNSFARLDAAGGLDRNNPFPNLWHVFNDVRDAGGLAAVTLRTIGIGIAAEFAILSAIQSVYIAQKELDRINAEQASRGGCG